MKNHSFALLSSILCEDNFTWEDKIFLTFDIDWAHEEIIEDVLKLCIDYSVPATFFATHKTDLLCGSMMCSNAFEVGLHPNFNYLLSGRSQEADFREICWKLKEYFPEASSVRSHSLCFSSLIQTVYQEIGITHDSSIMIPCQANNRSLFPWKMWDGLTRVPCFFSDYVTVKINAINSTNIHELILRNGLKVFDFHPIHVFLNTESLDRYEQTRPLHRNPKDLINYRYKGYGTRNQLIDLLELAKKS
ncbi:hypothetical protein RYO59_002460 [Thermosynechococcaceae cyanobacterium Okahandja]